MQKTNDKKRQTGTEWEIKLSKWSQTSKYNWSKVTINGGCKRTVSFYSRKQNASRVFVIVRASVRPSVCLSVTLVICIKTVQARNTKSSLLAVPRSLVYRDKISCHWCRGSPRTRGTPQGGVPPKKTSSSVIGSNNVKTVADKYIHAAYHNKHWWQAFWIYQHRWPWTTLNPSKRGFQWIFRNFWMQRTFQQWIATKWLEID